MNRLAPLLTAVAVVALAAGCAKKSTDAGSNAGAMSTAATLAGPDLEHGKRVFTQNCAACHGATGEGGAGPTLKGEKARKDRAAAIAWIKEPTPPMPKLYPSPLSDKDVADVAAYVESL